MTSPRDPNPRLKRFARDLRTDMSDAERRLWSKLRDRRFDRWKFRRQVPIEGYIGDFCCLDAKLVVELDGGQHGTPNGEARDERRTRTLEAAGFRVLRFWNNVLLRETAAVMREIHGALTIRPSPRPSPGVPGEGAN